MFCASLADVFDNKAPSTWREELFALIRKCDKLDWLLLTKRPQKFQRCFRQTGAMGTGMCGLV